MTQQLTVTVGRDALDTEGAGVAMALRRRFGGVVAPVADGTDDQLAIEAAFSLADALDAAVAGGGEVIAWTPVGEHRDATKRALIDWIEGPNRRGGMAHNTQAAGKCPKLGNALAELIGQL